ncbi:hypothetical protein MHB42_20605 [Lysinibacillus sp. FSL K6-0232]|uniref:hypothetical protein n=1 Tax=Lysinibacillus sp. FSL K6-0232 TaxID=2921425 RepID=UPI0030F6FEE8
MDEQAEIIEENVVTPVPEIDFTELETKLTDLVEVLETEQEQKQLEAEKQAQEAEEQAKIEEEQAKIEAEAEEQLQAESAATDEFRQNLLTELQVFNEGVRDYTEYFEAIVEHQKVELELYNAVYYASVIVIIFGCLLPLFWIVRQFKNILNWFI